VGTFHVTIEVGDPQGRRYEAVEALVDTGATYTVVPASMLRRLGATPHTRAPFELADGRQRELEVGRSWVRIGVKAELTLVAFGDEGVEPMLGAYAMERFLLAPDPVRRRLVEVPGLLM
jgi:predicted aspartyl protease